MHTLAPRKRGQPAKLICITISACAVFLSFTVNAYARPPHKKALADYFDRFLDRKLNDCRTCHLPDKPSQDETEKPHNPFGKRVAEVRRELKKAGKKSDIAARLKAIANEDSDGDGVANFLELISGHYPGDVKDTPPKSSLEAAEKKLTAFFASRKGYRWRPFDTVRRPKIPTVKNTEWVRNPVDAFIAHEHEKRGLRPSPEARNHFLLRRVYLDLIGLPPTPEEMSAFLNAAEDNPQAAYEGVVDRLLASPHYGERWGRHWMDVWRYSDWYGYRQQVRNSKPHVWRWRDWIVESLNEDKGYDRMVQEMLAGDELAPEDPKVLRATGFLVRNWYVYNRNVWLDSTIEHTAKAFLGVTINCARCHDHMYDPITQKEYYQFRAFFEPHQVRTDRVPGQPDIKKDGLVRVYDSSLDAKTYLFIRGEEKAPDKKHPLSPAVPSFLTWDSLPINSVKLPPAAVHPEKRKFVIAELLAASEARLAKSRDGVANAQRAGKPDELLDLACQLAQKQHEALKAVLQAEALEDVGDKGERWKQVAIRATSAQRLAKRLQADLNVKRLRQALVKAPRKNRAATMKKLRAAQLALKKAEATLKQPPSTKFTPRSSKSYPATSTGRRLALARWITDKKNPLTARVAVNHIWQRHFGKPLVTPMFDFGRNGKRPTHPALLDWLAAEFTECNWSMKHIHRLLVTSSTYQQGQSPPTAVGGSDPDNRYLWRMNSRRMEAEIVRDSVLAVAGQLDRTFGGPEIDAKLGLTTRRRSLYYRHAPEKMMPFLKLFDPPNVNECYRRSESIAPQQALALANSGFVQAQARLLARKLAGDIGPATPKTAAAFVRFGFNHVLCRPPTADEQALCGQFLSQQVQMLRDPKKLKAFDVRSPSAVPPSADPNLRSRENLIQVLLNHNEFVTIR